MRVRRLVDETWKFLFQKHWNAADLETSYSESQLCLIFVPNQLPLDLVWASKGIKRLLADFQIHDAWIFEVANEIIHLKVAY